MPGGASPEAISQSENDSRGGSERRGS
jgi:hypothetical protein